MAIAIENIKNTKNVLEIKRRFNMQGAAHLKEIGLIPLAYDTEIKINRSLIKPYRIEVYRDESNKLICEIELKLDRIDYI